MVAFLVSFREYSSQSGAKSIKKMYKVYSGITNLIIVKK